MNKAIFFTLSLSAAGSVFAEKPLELDLLHNVVVHSETAYIASQCYTKTQDANNPHLVSNPCYSCHMQNKLPNYVYEDDDIQERYSFPEMALKNPFTNLFIDRRPEIAKISDQEILDYVRQDNYKNAQGQIILAEKLNALPAAWDANANGRWDGYIPDCEFNFDDEGFDRKANGAYTGWRAFAYYPFLGTFWPSNGSMDDVLIRLPEIYAQNQSGEFDLATYKLNLLITESLIKQRSIKIPPVDESLYDVDLNQDGIIGISEEIVFKWTRPTLDVNTLKLGNFSMSYVGMARKLLLENRINIAPGLYPQGTEFLHSVRYMDVQNGRVSMAARMKELRYGVKTSWQSYWSLRETAAAELKDKHDFPDGISRYVGNTEQGLYNQKGWRFQAFIEDAHGDLRPQNYEETLFCMGCHTNLGATADSTFVFQRKFERGTHKDGWYHWSEKGFEGIHDYLINGQGEYAKYLELNNAGDEFRGNSEIMRKFFVDNWQNKSQHIEKEYQQNQRDPAAPKDNSWKLKTDAMQRLSQDISYLLLPSGERALELDKAYKIIVQEQSFIYGRDASVSPSANVHREVRQDQSTGIKKHVYQYK